MKLAKELAKTVALKHNAGAVRRNLRMTDFKERFAHRVRLLTDNNYG